MHGSPRSCTTDRQVLSWQQPFFKRVISLSSVRWFFSSLNEQWWRERSADGLVAEFRVKQVRGHHVAGLLLEEDLSSLWVVITCERGVFGQGTRLLIWRRASGILPRWQPHGGRGSAQGSGTRRKDRRNTRKGARWGTESQRTDNTQAHDMDDYVDEKTRTNTFLSHAVWCATISACSLHEKKWRVRCTVYTSVEPCFTSSFSSRGQLEPKAK